MQDGHDVNSISIDKSVFNSQAEQMQNMYSLGMRIFSQVYNHTWGRTLIVKQLSP